MDHIIPALIAKELHRQREGIELIASENFASAQVIKAMGTVLPINMRKAIRVKRYYGGCEVVDEVEQLAIDRLKELFGVEYANVQPHSGVSNNAAIFCMPQSFDKVLGFNLSHGGNLSHGSPVNYSGRYIPRSLWR